MLKLEDLRGDGCFIVDDARGRGRLRGPQRVLGRAHGVVRGDPLHGPDVELAVGVGALPRQCDGRASLPVRDLHGLRVGHEQLVNHRLRSKVRDELTSL